MARLVLAGQDGRANAVRAAVAAAALVLLVLLVTLSPGRPAVGDQSKRLRYLSVEPQQSQSANLPEQEEGGASPGGPAAGETPLAAAGAATPDAAAAAALRAAEETVSKLQAELDECRKQKAQEDATSSTNDGAQPVVESNPSEAAAGKQVAGSGAGAALQQASPLSERVRPLSSAAPAAFL